MTTTSPFHRRVEDLGPSQVDRALSDLLGAAAGLGRGVGLTGWVARTLRQLDMRDRRRLDRRLTQRLMGAVTGLWERGWQPRDLSHVAGRADRRVTALAAGVITEQARRGRSLEHAPPEWLAQLRRLADETDIDVLAAPVDQPWLAVGQQVAAGAVSEDAWTNVLVLTACLERLPSLEPLLPPPSAWTPSRPRGPRDPAGSQDRDAVMRKIKALLAKAEATEYEAEAEAFTAKAQDLISRYAIDTALLHASVEPDTAVVGRRVHLDSPYVLEKAQLLSAVAQANRAQVVTVADLGMAVVVGSPVDVDQIEMLFASVLIQATRAMAEAGRSGRKRSSPFRRAFLLSYAMRIGERLTEADDRVRAAYGSELVPVLDRQAQAVAAEFDRMFPRVRSRAVNSLDFSGWEAGRTAADRAVFVTGQVTPG